MIDDPEDRGRRVAGFYARIAASLFADLAASDLLADPADEDARARARREWECFALYACVRGLVAESGFNRETATSIEAFHERAIADWSADHQGGETEEERRRLVSARYDEYGAIGQAGGASGAATVARRLGEAAAGHLTDAETRREELAVWLGAVHEAIAEGVVETLRSGNGAPESGGPS